MKTIALLAIGAALALAAPQDDKKASDAKTPATEGAKTKAKPAIVGPSQSAKRNVQKPSAAPADGQLTPEQKAAAALPTVPQGAQEVGSNLFRYTDKEGKVWMYRKTPFGVSKWEEKPEDRATQHAPQAEPPGTVPTTMTDLGDSVQFQRPTPFGPQKWIRKKSEMSDDEKAAFAKQTALGNKPADAAKPPEQH